MFRLEKKNKEKVVKKLKPNKQIKKKKQVVQDVPIIRYQTDIEHGLSEEQINERKEHKLVNDTKIRTSNSYFSIIRKNILTVFNMIWIVIAVALMCVGAWGDLLFLFVVIANTAISIFQEIKSKITVEKLSMVSVPKIKVMRTGLQLEVKSEDLLLDDIILLENGNQIPADCIIIEGDVEANESLLTGESVPIKKIVGDTLLAGSFLTSGVCYARVDKVGKNNYIQTVAERTKDFKPQTSNLFKDLNSLIKVIILILIPVGALTFCKEFFIAGTNIKDSITSTSGALEGMIPAGMYLLITVGLTVGVMKLARKKTLVKNIYSIEMLARANVLCLDKTGTITDGTMNVVETSLQNGATMLQVEGIMKAVLANQKSSNATSVALTEHFGKDIASIAKHVVEFSSQRKYSATTLRNGKTYYIGAPSFIGCKISEAQIKTMKLYMEQGLRVIALVEDNHVYNEKSAGKEGKILAFFALEDHIRKDAIETIGWFKQNNVEVKIISGDDALTVSKIAKRVGVENSDKYISLEGMSLQEVAQIADKFTVFGRVTPEQKHTIVKTLKTQGKVVAMTGDGVNDTLALKEANCSIAMADGSEVARNISHLVLMESNFSALPSIVKEGRKIVNNVQNSSVLYLMKTLFTMILCITTLILRISYPFTPSQMLLLEMFVIGLPSFMMTFQPNDELIKGNFIPQVMKKTIPCAMLMFINILTIVIVKENTTILSGSEYTTLVTLLLTIIGFVNLVSICCPLNWYRAFCCILPGVLIIAAVIGLGSFFKLTDFTPPVITLLLTMIACSVLISVIAYFVKRWFLKRRQEALANGTKENKFMAKITDMIVRYEQDESTEEVISDIQKLQPIEDPLAQQKPKQEGKQTQKSVAKKKSASVATKSSSPAKSVAKKSAKPASSSKKSTVSSKIATKNTSSKNKNNLMKK